MKRRVLKSRLGLTAMDWVTLFLLVLFGAFALIPEVRDWVLDHLQQFLAEFVNGGIDQLARTLTLLLHSV
jgi:hypothetical protein